MKRIFKRFIALLLTILCLFSFGGCGNLSKNNSNSSYFSGRVVEILDDRCLIEVTDAGNQNFAINEQVFVSTNIENCPKISVGDNIKIEFDGCMALSYPPLLFRVYAIEKIS